MNCISADIVLEYLSKGKAQELIEMIKSLKQNQGLKTGKYPHDFFDDDKFPIQAKTKREMHNICEAARQRGIKNVGERTYTNGTFEVVRTHYET